MKPKLSVSLEFLHLENALFCAEQSVSAGVEILEIGSTLLKSTGLTSIKVLRERFPNVTLVADMKVQNNIASEIKAIVDAGANSITISGSASPDVWKESIDIASEYNVEIILDFRDIVQPQEYITENIPEKINIVMFSLKQNGNIAFSLLQKATSSLTIPVAVRDVQEEDDIAEAISLGASIISVSFCDAKEKNIQEAVKKIQKILSDTKKTFPEDPVSLHEEQLFELLDQVAPSDFCEVIESPCFLDEIFPIQKYTKIIGKVATLKTWPGSELAVLEFLLTLQPKTILVIDAGGRGAAVWGQMATEIAIKKGLTAVVINGSIKEVNKIREKSFPCYTTSMSSKMEKKQSMAIDEHCTLKIGEVFISSGDWLIGNDTGIVCISQNNVFLNANKALKRYKDRMRIIRDVDTAEEDSLDEIIRKYKQLYSVTN